MPKLFALTYVIAAILILQVRATRIMESVTFADGELGYAFELYDYVSVEQKLTVMAWVGVQKLSGMGIMRLNSKTGHIDIKADVQDGATRIYMQNDHGVSDKLSIAETNVDTKNWARLAVSFKISTTVSPAFLFVEDQRTELANLFAGAKGLSLILGSTNQETHVVEADVGFLELTFLKQFLDTSVLNETIQSFFEFEPNLSILIQTYKHGPYTKRYFNHVIRQPDVESGVATSYGIPANIYTSLESIGSNLKLTPRPNYRGSIDQSYVVAIRMDLFYRDTALTNQQFLHRVPVHSRVTSGGALIFENAFKMDYGSISVIDGVNNVEFTNSILSTNEVDMFTKSYPLPAAINKLPVKLYMLKVRKTLHDPAIKITMKSDLLGEQIATIGGDVLDSDKIYIGASNAFGNPKYAAVMHQMVKLKVYEVSFFYNSRVDWRASEADKVITGLSESPLVLDCDDATEGIKRVSLDSPYDIAFNSCVSEPYAVDCPEPNCNICEGATCYDCKIGYELTGGSCAKCELADNVVYDPYLRKCLPYINTLPAYSGSDQYSLTVDPTAHGVTYGSPGLTEVHETRLVIKLSLSAITEPHQYKLYFDEGSVTNYNMLQFFDDSIIDEDGFVYLSFDIPDVEGALLIEKDANFSATGFIAGKSEGTSMFSTHFKNFRCYRDDQLYYQKVSFNSIKCDDLCTGARFIDDINICTNCNDGCTSCTSFDSCGGCSAGYLLKDGRCVECSDNCSTCSETPDSCDSCDGGLILEAGATKSYCREEIPDAEVTETNQAVVDSTLVEPSDEEATDCEEGFYFDVDLEGCENCPTGCKSCISYSLCTLCLNGFELVAGRCITLADPEVQEPAEETDDEDPGVESCDMQLRDKCVICADRHHKNSEQSCEPCESHCSECLDSSDCSICDPTLELVDKSCIRVADDGHVYEDDGQFVSCALCENCHDCPTCSKCLSFIEYAVLVEDNVMAFVFPETVVLIDNVADELSSSTQRAKSSDNIGKKHSLLSDAHLASNGTNLSNDINGLIDDQSEIFSNDYFEVRKVNCNIAIALDNITISGDAHSLQFEFKPSGPAYECYLSLQLKSPVIKSVEDGLISFRNHIMYLHKAPKDRSDEILEESFETATKVVMFSFAPNSHHTFSAIVFYMSEINLMFLFLLTQFRYYHSIAEIIDKFLINFEIKIKIANDDEIEEYYDARLEHEEIVDEILEEEYFILIDVRIFIVIAIFILRLLNKYMPSDNRVINSKYFKRVFLILERMSLLFIVTEAFIFVFRRIILYRHLDMTYTTWAYLLVDFPLFSFLVYGIYKTVQIHTSVSEKFDLKQKYDELMIYYHPDVKYSEYYTSLMVLRNILTSVVIIYTRGNVILLALLTNLILVLFIAYAARIIYHIRDITMAFNMFTDIAILLLFNLIVFYTENSGLEEILLFACLAISGGSMTQALFFETREIKHDAIFKFLLNKF